MAITEEELKQHNLQRAAIARSLTLSWNKSISPSDQASGHLPNLSKLTDIDLTLGNLQNKFNVMYSTLESFDAPRPPLETTEFFASTKPEDIKKFLNNAAGSAVGISKPIRYVTPIAPEKQNLRSRSPSITLNENIEINYQKRALSFFHGAILAIQYDPQLSNQQKVEAANKILAVYDRFKNGPERNGWLENKYEAQWGRKQSYYLKKMLVRMALTLEEYHLDYKDLCAGEMVANLDRLRPKEIISELQTPFDDNRYISTAKISETPLSSHMDNHTLKMQFKFLDDRRHKTPDWFKELKPVVQQYLLAHKDDPNLPAMPATLRGVPGLANMNLHTAEFKTTQSGKFNVKHQVIRHGTLTPYEMDDSKERMSAARANGQALAEIIVKEAKKNYAEFWADKNMLKVKIPVADMSLMSPIDVPFKYFPNEEDLARRQLNNTGLQDSDHTVYDERYTLKSESNSFLSLFQIKKTKDSNLAMKKENRDAYLYGMNSHPEASKFDITQHNLGINGDRYQQSLGFCDRDYKAATKKTLDQFDLVRRYVDELETDPFKNNTSRNKFELGKQAADELERIKLQFGKPYNEAGTQEIQLSRRINAELFANGLYAMVVQGMGGTVSACCKSTKDRTGLFILHLDAMHEYYAQTGKLIKFDAPEDSPERKRFVDIMVNLYLANTQQYAAGQATLGSAGIKKPGGGLGNMEPIPTDFMKALEVKSPGLFTRQKELADANKIKFNMTLNPAKILQKMHRVGNWSLWYYEKLLYNVDKVIDRFKNLGTRSSPRPS